MNSCKSTKPAERPLPNGLDVISSRTGEPVEYNSMFGTNTVVQVPRNSQFVCYSHGSIAYVAYGIVYDAKSHEPVTSSPTYGSEILKIHEGTRFFFPSGVTFFCVIDGKLYDVQSGERVEYRGFLSKSEAISVPKDSRFVFPSGKPLLCRRRESLSNSGRKDGKSNFNLLRQGDNHTFKGRYSFSTRGDACLCARGKGL